MEKKMRDRIKARLKKLSHGLIHEHCNPLLVARKVFAAVDNGATTSQIYEIAAAMAADHSDYSLIAARIAVSNLHDNTKMLFSNTIKVLYHNFNEISVPDAHLIADDVYNIIMENAARLDHAINHDRDSIYDYFGFKTLERSYLLKVSGKVVERPQHMLMRVAVGIHKDDIDSVVRTYNLMSEGWFTHAPTTLLNAGTPHAMLTDGFLIGMKGYGPARMHATINECRDISKYDAGIGISVHDIHSFGRYKRGGNQAINGLVGVLRKISYNTHYVDHGGRMRNGAIVVYLEPWHPYIFEFLDLCEKYGKEENNASDLSFALWIPDIFMRRVRANKKWSLFCPTRAPGLADSWGKPFENLYTKYERQGNTNDVTHARIIWSRVVKSQIETGTPYLLYKDACNRRSNQQNLGTIKSSNSCTEILEYTSPTETAVCNLASIALPRFVREKGIPIKELTSKMVGSIGAKNRYFDFDKLAEITAIVTGNLNKIIDVNHYPVKTAEKSNMRNRPIGIGVQGLADTFVLLGMPFDSEEAQQLNVDIFETIYHHALRASSELAAKDGWYESYPGCPLSKGILQHDMRTVTPSTAASRRKVTPSTPSRWDWPALREMISRNGVRNSLLVAAMATASTSQILGDNESFEPYTSNICSRRVPSGEFEAVNKHLQHDLTKLGLWSQAIKNKIMYENGSVVNVPEIPEDLKAIYKTAWEIKRTTVVDMAVDRGCYIDQSQSLNIHMDRPDIKKLTKLHFYGWEEGLKTGMYHLCTRAAADADTSMLKNIKTEEVDNLESKMAQVDC